jgi:hypothetical protein
MVHSTIPRTRPTFRNPPQHTENKNPNCYDPPIKFLSISPSQSLDLQEALSLLHGSQSKITSGVRHLGIPIGSTSFAKSFLDSAASTFATTLFKLSHHIYDCQTMGALYCHCAIPPLSHLLATDVYHNTAINATPNLFGWHSSFVSKVQQASDSFLMTLTDQHQSFPPLSWLLAHSPIPTGGIGFPDHCDSAITSFLVPLARSFRDATSGIQIQEYTVPVPTIYSQPLSAWLDSLYPTHIFQLFHHHLGPLLQQQYIKTRNQTRSFQFG